MTQHEIATHEPIKLDLGRFKSIRQGITWTGRVHFTDVNGLWHVLTQRAGQSASALCQTVGIVQDQVSMTDQQLCAKDYGICIDCREALRLKTPAPHITFKPPPTYSIADCKRTT